MRIYLFISKEKKMLQMYLPYIEALNQKFDICQNLADADIVLIFGAWTRKGAQLASKSRKMGIPYIVCPLGDISERNRQNPHLKRMMQTLMYQKSMYKHANLLVASTPMERNYLMKLGWNNRVILTRYFGYSHLTTLDGMMHDWNDTSLTTLSDYEQRKAEAIAKQTEQPIIAHLFHQFHTVVDDEGNIHDLAPFLHLVGDGAHFIIRGILHAELNPSAESRYRLVTSGKAT